MKYAYLVLGVALSFASFAQEEVLGSLDNVNREIAQVRAKIVQNEKDNPHVYFNEQDNPTRNIQRTMKDVRINREFYCPNHRGFKYENGVCGWIENSKYNYQLNRRGLSCGAASNNINGYSVWQSYCTQAGVTEKKDAENKRLQSELQALLDQRKALAQASAERPSRKTAGPGNEAGAIVIRLPKKKVFELYSNKVVYHEGYKFVVQNN